VVVVAATAVAVTAGREVAVDRAVAAAVAQAAAAGREVAAPVVVVAVANSTISSEPILGAERKDRSERAVRSGLGAEVELVRALPWLQFKRGSC
jgi:hypothetical protein